MEAQTETSSIKTTQKDEERSEESPIIESKSSKHTNPILKKCIDSQKYILAVIAVIIIGFILYNAYKQFCDNRVKEPYINEQPKTHPQSDTSFDMDLEVKKLIRLQEEYLSNLRK